MACNLISSLDVNSLTAFLLNAKQANAMTEASGATTGASISSTHDGAQSSFVVGASILGDNASGNLDGFIWGLDLFAENDAGSVPQVIGLHLGTAAAGTVTDNYGLLMTDISGSHQQLRYQDRVGAGLVW